MFGRLAVHRVDGNEGTANVVDPSAPPSQIRGVSPVLLTPFHPDGQIDMRSFRRSVEEVIGAGPSSVMFPGFASEFHLLDDSERWSLLNELMRATEGSSVLVTGSVTDGSTYLAHRTAAELVDRGVAAINLLPPWMQNPPLPAVLDHVSAVAEIVAPLPVILQYAPEATPTRLSVSDIRKIAARHSNLTSVKVELRSPTGYIRELRDGEVPIWSLLGNGGMDLPAALDAGVVGVQPGGGFVEVYVAIWGAWEAGDSGRAHELYRRLLPYLSHWMADGVLLQAAKSLAYRRGHIDSPACRQPSRELSPYAGALTTQFLRDFAAELGWGGRDD